MAAGDINLTFKRYLSVADPDEAEGRLYVTEHRKATAPMRR